MNVPDTPHWSRPIRSTQKLPTGDLIPQSSWGASLANLLLGSHWQTFRERAIARAEHRCELCDATDAKQSLEAHEMWSYQLPTSMSTKKFGIQKLDDVIAVCKQCHLCFHLGYAQVRGMEDVALRRLKALNKWSDAQLDAYQGAVWTRWQTFSNFSWALDLKGHDVGEGLILKSNVERDSKTPYLLKTKSGGTTALLNASFKIKGELHFSTVASKA